MKIRSLAIAGLFAVSVAHATLVQEKFTTDPSLDGWRAFGGTNLFQWDPADQALDVTWDSTQPNSYYYHPLGVCLTTNDSFCVQFDLQVSNAVAYNGGQQLAIGLLHWCDATNAAFSRPLGSVTNIFEFDYFPAFNYDGYSNPDSVNASIVDAAGDYYFDNDSQSLLPGITYHVVLLHYAGSIGISGVIYTNGQVMSTFPEIENYYPPGDDGSFIFDTLAVTSYADDGYADEDIFAQGTIANLSCATPLPVGLISTPAAGQVQFTSDTNWVYTLEQTTDFQTWTPVAPAAFGNGTNLLLQDTNPPAANSFYSIRADLP